MDKDGAIEERSSELAIALGVAGLLPQALALLSRLLGIGGINQGQVALAYGTLILSFLGGAWWGIALLRARGRWRTVLLLLGVGASLAGFCLQGLATPGSLRPLLIGLAVLIAVSCLVDRALVRAGMMGTWWWRLRLVLSLGLGALTLAVGVLS